MTALHIVTAPDVRLKQISKPVAKIDKEIKTLIRDMIETMNVDRGVGLAAIQVGHAKRIIVLDLGEDDDEERPADFYPFVMVNPEIIDKQGEMVVAKEGCLSVPALTVDVPRPNEIKVKYQDKNGVKREMEAQGWLARVIQHEIDHLDGVILIDYLSKLKKDLAISKLKKIKKQLL